MNSIIEFNKLITQQKNMEGVKSDVNKSSIRKTREFWGKSWLESSVEVPENIGEREKERAVKELALFVDQGIDAGLHLPNISIPQPDKV